MIGQSAGKSFAYILGVYLGDGCVTVCNGYTYFKLNTIDEDFASATAAALADIGCRHYTQGCHPVSKSSKPNHTITASGEFCEVLKRDTKQKSEIPAYVWEWDRANKLAFIAGLMDSEGFVAANRNPTNRRFYMGFKSCDLWVPVFVRILESVGIRVGKVAQEAPRKPGYKVPTRFTIKMQSWIDAGAYFNIARKQSRVEEWSSEAAYEQRSKRRLTSETTRLAA